MPRPSLLREELATVPLMKGFFNQNVGLSIADEWIEDGVHSD